jgi:phage/plasmid-like protein (TIGR03299 family)
MPDMVETYAGTGTAPWWAGISPTAKSMVLLEGEAVSGSQIKEAAGLDWTVSKRELSYREFIAGVPTSDLRRVPKYIGLVRDSDDSFLGIAKTTYHTFQNTEALETMDLVLGAADEVGEAMHYVTAGALFGGAICWALAKFDKDLHVRGDGSPLTDYLLGYWGHDGGHGYTLADTMIRVVCSNTATAALDGATDKVTIRHTQNMAGRIEEARKALDVHAKYRETLVETLNALTTKRMTLNEVTDFTVKLLPANPEAERAYRTEAERQAILDIYQTSELLGSLPKTAYRAYNAVTEYADHHVNVRTTKSGSGEDRRAFSIVEGPAYSLKSRALSLLVKA